MQRSEFSIASAYTYDRRSVARWLLSHVGRYWSFTLGFYLCFITAWAAYSGAQAVIGRAADVLSGPPDYAALTALTLGVLALMVTDSFSALIGSLSAETVAARVEADIRQEFYESLLAKSKAFHDRQRAGDLMARATDDTNLVANMIVPGTTLISETVLGIVVPLTFIFFTEPRLIVIPLLFVIGYIITAHQYLRRLMPVIQRQREQYGLMNAGLEETISGIEVVKASAREALERSKYLRNAQRFRDLFIEQGRIEARYLPLLLFGIALGAQFFHALWLYSIGEIGLGQVVAVIGLMNVLRFPTFISLFAFSVFQAGLAGARRILSIINAETDLDENLNGYSAPLRGEITFEHVSFSFAAHPDEAPHQVLHDISFHIPAGQTVAIVGQTGSGKSALTQLVNRTYDAISGRVLIDGVDVRDWNLDALRSRIGKIEQDIFLFSRTIAENIAFGAPGATQAEIEAAARAAQVHEFISRMPDGYQTVIGERGVTLSGGQRQRIALARAFLAHPRILILDDSTSAIDSATEDEIQRAIRQAQQGRTVLLITHRLAQIRWADQILVLDSGRLVASGKHEELLRTSPHYRRIFARYEHAVPETGVVRATEGAA
ncbi:MAG: ABC transporter ATP-binding protein [Chloroflexus sp.]|nr:ABC transporter ATP-binding protein [Chloroflexus sp.]MBO9374492.1 ABC transporter ATP-binding protein [Chloroflexus sp.]